MRILGLDVGAKTIGVAISDAFGWTAQGLTTIIWNENDMNSANKPLKEIIEEHQIGKAVIGLPKHMNGSIGDRGRVSQAFATHIETTFHIPTVLWDERLTTKAAERTLLEADMSRKKRKKVIDMVAAAMILQGYLDKRNKGVD